MAGPIQIVEHTPTHLFLTMTLQGTRIKNGQSFNKLTTVEPPLHPTPVTQLEAVESENDKDDSSFEISVKIGVTSSHP